MNRRSFIELLSYSGASVVVSSQWAYPREEGRVVHNLEQNYESIHADVAIVGGGLGGFAAAMAALRNGLTVILTEETDWIGGQLTSQGVPPDEHQWIETHGSTALYRDFRNRVRDYYRRNYPLRSEKIDDPLLNPGNGLVSRLCHEPKVALAVMEEMIAPYVSNRKLVVLYQHRAVRATTIGTKTTSVSVKDLFNHRFTNLIASYYIDATELGELLPLTGTDFVTGTESKEQFNELHAPEKADPENNQSFTMCFAMDYVHGEDHTIPRPRDYDFWLNHVPSLSPPWSGKILGLHYSDPRTLNPKKLGFHPLSGPTGDLLNLWNYRKIVDKNNFLEGFYSSDITIVNWPQNDYMLGNLIGASEEEFNKHIDNAKQLSLSLLYWLQTEANRPDGGKGWKGLRLRKDIMGTADGLAKYPYVRESRRIKSVFTVTEEHVGKENRALVASSDESKHHAAVFYDSVGTGYYHIDLHPSCHGVNYVDFPSLPFQIPLGALIPIRMDNILPANKNIGTTHITNGCFRLHPVEWSIGEAVGLLVDYSKRNNVIPREVRNNSRLLKDFQKFISSEGLEIFWSNGI